MRNDLLFMTIVAMLPASTLAQTSIVLSGSIDLAVETLNSDANDGKSDVAVSDGVWKGSRFTLSGSEEIGGGIKGLFNLEHRLSADTGTVTSDSKFWAGQAWVGLQGRLGTVRLGRQYAPVRRALEPGDMTDFGWYNNGDGLGGITRRFDNDLSYQSPELGGIAVHAAYAAGESTETPLDVRRGDAYGIAGVGDIGRARIGVGYQRIDAGDSGVDDTSELAVSIGARFGGFGVGLAGARREAEGIRRQAYFLSGSAKAGKGTMYLTLKHDDQGTRLDDLGLGLTYSHGLSKRTLVYASIGLNKIEQVTGADTRPKRIALGVRHFF